MLGNLDNITGLKEISGAHARASEGNDVEWMISVLSSYAVFVKLAIGVIATSRISSATT